MLPFAKLKTRASLLIGCHYLKLSSVCNLRCNSILLSLIKKSKSPTICATNIRNYQQQCQISDDSEKFKLTTCTEDEDTLNDEPKAKATSKMCKYTFQMCILDLRNFYEKSIISDDNMANINVNQCLQKYLNCEDRADVFEGFVRLICHIDMIKIAKHRISLIKILLNTYFDILLKDPELSKQIVESKNPEIIINALLILAGLKFGKKYGKKISIIFQLDNPSTAKFLEKVLSEIIENADQKTQIDIYEQSIFEKLVCLIILMRNENFKEGLDNLIGDVACRKNALPKYLDKLIGYHFNEETGVNELENKIIEDIKQLRKITKYYANKYHCEDSEVPNLINSAAYDAFIINYDYWKNGKKNWQHLMALNAIVNRTEVRDKYFNFLCEQGLADKAVYLAEKMNLKESAYPQRLQHFLQQNRQISSIIREEIKREDKIRQKNEEKTEDICTLDDGTPIYMVNDKASFNELNEILCNCNKNKEQIIGIDAEYGPQYMSIIHRISLLQIAISNAIYIVDVLLLLEGKDCLTEEDWLKFFINLFCNNARIIGYNLKGDLLAIKRTFRFLDYKLIANSTNICLSKLFFTIMNTPDVSKIIFGAHPPKKLDLTVVTKHFLGLRVNSKYKSTEFDESWCTRPLTIKRKIYAAMDAHSVRKLYQHIAPVIKNQLSTDQQLRLRNFALVNINPEEKQENKDEKNVTDFLNIF